METEVKRISELIGKAIRPPARAATEVYFDNRNRFAAASFNTLGANDPFTIGEDDLLAVHLLGINFDPLTVRQLLFSGTNRNKITRLLRTIDTRINLWDDNAEIVLDPARELWQIFNDLYGVGWVTAGKLLARKRPRLVPVFDSVVKAYFKPPKDGFWEMLYRALRGSDLPNRIERELRLDSLRGDAMEAKVTTLRLLDVAVWMNGMQYGPYATYNTDS